MGQSLYVTPVDGASAKLVLSEKLQTAVVREKPYGRFWRLVDFDVHIGQPLSKSIVSHVSSLFPGTRVGNLADASVAGVTISPDLVDIELGTDDAMAANLTAAFGVFAFGADADIHASVTLDVRLDSSTGSETERVVGKASKTVNYITISPKTGEEILAQAIDDAARQVGEVAAAYVKKASLARQ